MWSGLKTLAISSFPLMGNSVFKSVPKGLASLIASDLPRVNDEGLQHLVRCTRDLICIDISQCPLVTIAGVQRLVQAYRNLSVLNIAGCLGVDLTKLRDSTESHSYLRVVQSNEQLSESSSLPEGLTPFQGLRFTATTTKAKIQDDFFQQQALAITAARQIQGGYKKVLAKREDAHRRRQKRLHRHNAAASIQRAFRTSRAQWRARRVHALESRMAGVPRVKSCARY